LFLGEIDTLKGISILVFDLTINEPSAAMKAIVTIAVGAGPVTRTGPD
jgi:hypothetical protein